MADTELFIPPEDIEKVKVLGKGAFGDVYLCKWNGERGGGKDVAVKMMNGLGEQQLNDFKLEVKVTSAFDNENITKVWGYSQDENTFMIVLEYINGGDLYDMLNKKLYNLLSWDRKWRLVEQCAQSIEYLHTHKPPILHRDIKSPNYLITKDLTTLKLCDFGMSDLGMDLKSKEVKGSTRWLAPETIGQVKWSTKADVFAFAMTVYEICTSKLPFFEVEDPSAVSDLIKHERQRPDLGANIPEKFKTLMRKCWEHAPDRRPTMTEALKYIRASKENEDVDFEIAYEKAEIDETMSEQKVVSRNLKDTKRLFFEIRKDDLLNCCTDDQISVRTQPPTIPPHILGDYKLPPVPESVTIVKLTRSFSINPLTSNSYATDIYQRVELLFRRFFDTETVSNKVQLECVEVILNDALEQRFREKEALLHERGEGIGALKDKHQSKLGRQYLKRLMLSDNLITRRNSNGLSAWHGANREKLDSIIWFGLLNLSSRDPGYYGKAIYLTQEPSYGSYYTSQKAKEEGAFELLLCWLTIGRPYAVTKVELGRPKEEGYDSHYVVVRHKQPTKDVFVYDKDFKYLENNGEQHFPVRSFEEEKVEGDELAVFDSDQALPRFIVSYKVLQNNIKMNRREASQFTNVQACVNAFNLQIDNKDECCLATKALAEMLNTRTKPGEAMSFRQTMKIEQTATETRGANGIPALIKVMEKHSFVEDLIADSVHVLRVCAQEDEPSRGIIQQSKGIQIIIGSMMRFFDRESMLITACAALWHLSTSEEERKNIVKNGGVEAVINSMKRFPDNLELLTEAMGVMWKLSVDEETLEQMLRHDAPRYILDAMKKYPDWADLQCAGNGALWNLATPGETKEKDDTNKDLIELIKKCKGIEAIQQNMARFTDDEYQLLRKQGDGALQALQGKQKKSILGRLASAYKDKMRHK